MGGGVGGGGGKQISGESSLSQLQTKISGGSSLSQLMLR